MHQRLRLARARGSLTAPNNRVQDFALDLLDMAEMTEAELRRLDRVRQIVLGGADIEQVRMEFPEYFRPEDPYEEATDPETGEFDIDRVDDSKLDWGVPDAETDEALSRWISEREQGSVSAADLDNNWI